MVVVYADLVELGLRALNQQDATAWNCPIVPAFLREKVQAEINRREKEYAA